MRAGIVHTQESCVKSNSLMIESSEASQLHWTLPVDLLLKLVNLFSSGSTSFEGQWL